MFDVYLIPVVLVGLNALRLLAIWNGSFSLPWFTPLLRGPARGVVSKRVLADV